MAAATPVVPTPVIPDSTATILKAIQGQQATDPAAAVQSATGTTFEDIARLQEAQRRRQALAATQGGQTVGSPSGPSPLATFTQYGVGQPR